MGQAGKKEQRVEECKSKRKKRKEKKNPRKAAVTFDTWRGQIKKKRLKYTKIGMNQWVPQRNKEKEK